MKDISLTLVRNISCCMVLIRQWFTHCRQKGLVFYIVHLGVFIKKTFPTKHACFQSAKQAVFTKGQISPHKNKNSMMMMAAYFSAVM